MVNDSLIVSKKIIAAKKDLSKKYNIIRGEIRSDRALPNIDECIVYLAETMKLGSRELFIDYINWSAELFTSRSCSINDLKKDLHVLIDIATQKFKEEEVEVMKEYIEPALKELNVNETEQHSFLQPEKPYYNLAVDYLDILLSADREEAYQLIKHAVEEELAVKDIYLNVFEPVQKEIGRLWQLNEINVATEHYCTSVTQLIMARLYPYILNLEENGYSAVTTCVGDELHELGVRMIADLLEMEGWNTFHCGANTPKEDIIETIAEKEADIVCISVTMGNHLEEANSLIEELKKRERIETKIIVGGYPFNVQTDLWKEIGADGYAPDAEKSVEVIQDLIEN